MSRFHLDEGEVEECLLDFEAYGWVARSERSPCGGRRADRLEADVHRRFLPLNERFQQAVTRWQVRPLPGEPMATNDHTDFRWDDRVIQSLRSIGRRLVLLDTDLVGALARFGGYAERYNAAVARVVGGENRWVDGVGIDSCQVVWMQLHEDLIASLGLDRADEDWPAGDLLAATCRSETLAAE